MVSAINKKRYRILLAVLGLIVGTYLLFLWLAPLVPSLPLISQTGIDLNTQNDSYDKTNRIQIKKLNLEVPYYIGDSSMLEKGAWWRMPQNGNPKDGGNFVLSAHRFELGWTPAQTKQKSPFYHIDKLQIGDQIRVYYQNKWYYYKVANKHEVSQYALQIENRSQTPKLTLYSCSLRGPAAGRYVIEAMPKN
jgi:sortase A